MTVTAARPQIDPIRLPRPSRATSARRAGRIACTVGRHLVLRDPRRPVGPALRRTAEDLGPTFVKLGQLLASSPSVAGEATATALRGLLDQGRSVPFATVRRIIETDTGRRFDELFSSLESTPMAAASLAVVHRGVLLDGTPVAVKVLRPGVERVVAADLGVLGPLFEVMARQIPLGVLAVLPDAVESLGEQVAEELDLRNEARSMAWFSTMLDIVGADGVFVPLVHEHASGRRVLTMELVDGRSVDDLDGVDALGLDARLAVERLLRAWFAVTLCTGSFHGDMHAGNLLFTEDGRVALLDWGILGRLDDASRRFLRRSIEGAMGEEAAWDDVRAHIMPTIGSEVARMTGMTEDDIFAMIRGQIEMIMSAPFRDLNLLALAPQVQQHVDAPTPSGVREWVELLRSERRRLRRPDAPPPIAPDRGEALLVKQLLYFERIGRMHLGDQPLIWDAEVFTHLLALPQDDSDAVEV
jgi:hypothetical protein